MQAFFVVTFFQQNVNHEENQLIIQKKICLNLQRMFVNTYYD